MKRKVLCLLLIAAMLLSMTAFAQTAAEGNYLSEAQQLKILGVFQGTTLGFELNRQPTRLEGLVMLIRLLGAETQAKGMASSACAFTDVPTWGKGYVNYAYAHGLTNGIGNHLFGSTSPMNAASYTTFLLRALGYSDSKGDFSYDQSIRFAQKVGLYSAADVFELSNSIFLRDHLAKTSMLALGTAVKAGGHTLLQQLVTNGAIPGDLAAQIDPEAFSRLEVNYIDVGQADSILIIKGTHAMLIDGGNAADGTAVVDFIKAKEISKLDYVIATHPHEDHIGGLNSVVAAFEIGRIIMPAVVTTTQTYENLLDVIGSKGIPVIRPVYGASYDLSGASFTVLAPNSDHYDDLNDYSVVVRLVNGSNSFLFTGDAGAASESEMLSKNSQVLKSDVLKVGHHGSSTATSAAFLNAVSPAYAVISVGKDNDYGHPDQVTLDKLAAREIKTFRTDEQGTITATSNGHTIVFNVLPLRTTSLPASGPAGPSTPSNKAVIISGLDKKGEIVTLKNTGATAVDLTGWKLISVTGNQSYTIPSYVLKAGASVTIASGDASGNLKWTTASIWNNSSSDPAELYDAQGNLIYRLSD